MGKDALVSRNKHFARHCAKVKTLGPLSLVKNELSAQRRSFFLGYYELSADDDRGTIISATNKACQVIFTSKRVMALAKLKGSLLESFIRVHRTGGGLRRRGA